ncbi:transcriptional regulator, ArsR family [Alloactinosynnema sp. L-07]|uniref:ArsR/SmtB family transcription factor n=1 Tax=Alloactinosynnema sp. L-07 TaxID=1653480 RepID=UPI00065EF32A|nr:winged helix-turn-helix domain-containing protein [Alloactinosynnema sp. L-07]CRK55767.1 transcriptional regulator, ArsR family [Alloactinosynnema sp. L-07]
MTVKRDATPIELEALGSAIRLRIIRLAYQRPLTNKEIAERLDKDPATTLHHVRKLVAAGFLEALPVRRGNRGAKEIPYRATGVSWGLRFRGDERVDLAQAMLQAYLGEVSDAGLGKLQQTRLVVQVDEASRAELMERIGAVLDEYVQRPIEPGAERTAVYVAFYPGE